MPPVLCRHLSALRAAGSGTSVALCCASLKAEAQHSHQCIIKAGFIEHLGGGGKQVKKLQREIQKSSRSEAKKKKFLASCYFRRIKETLATL